MRRLLILGTRTLALEIADLVSETPGYEVSGFVENMEPERCRERLNGLPVHWIDDVAELAETHWALCGLATTKRHRFVDQVSALGLPFASVVHPGARLSSTASVAEGTILSVGAIVAAHSTIGRHVLLNRGALVGHHTEIADYVSVQPGANVAGACRIGEATYVGMGAVVLDHLTIGARSVIGAGAVVTKDVPDNVQVVGVPARIVKRDIEGK